MSHPRGLRKRSLATMFLSMVIVVGSTVVVRSPSASADTCLDGVGNVCRGTITKEDGDFSGGYFVNAGGAINLHCIRVGDAADDAVEAYVKWSNSWGEQVAVGVHYGDFLGGTVLEPAREFFLAENRAGATWFHFGDKRTLNQNVPFSMFWMPNAGDDGKWQGSIAEDTRWLVTPGGTFDRWFDPSRDAGGGTIEAGLATSSLTGHAYAGISNLYYTRHGRPTTNGWPNASRHRYPGLDAYVENIGVGWWRFALNSTDWDCD